MINKGYDNRKTKTGGENMFRIICGIDLVKNRGDGKTDGAKRYVFLQ